MDIIASENEKGDIKSTEFHFRVGKFKMLKCNLKRGNLFLNDEDTKMQMKFSNEGVAYFEFEKEMIDSDDE